MVIWLTLHIQKGSLNPLFPQLYIGCTNKHLSKQYTHLQLIDLITNRILAHFRSTIIGTVVDFCSFLSALQLVGQLIRQRL